MKKTAGARRGIRRIVNAMAPIRVCDLGGWTDTRFAGAGAVCNIAVCPCAEVQIFLFPRAPGKPRVTVCAENYGDRYQLDPRRIVYDKHPLIEASIDILDMTDLSFEVSLYSAAPPGCSTGTSAAVAVALLGALDMLTPGRRTAHEIAALAHRVETERLGLQSGIQDQLCSAYGGICFIEMFNYPLASVSRIALADSVLWELERRMVLVYLGRSHSSSEVHGRVIKGLERPGADKSVLEKLRRCAHAGKNALLSGDLKAFGRAMAANTEAQAELHPALVSRHAGQVIELARAYGATGWKVNGAGGEGGSLTILCGPEGEKKRALIRELESAGTGWRVIPTHLARTGLRRWETAGRA